MKVASVLRGSWHCQKPGKLEVSVAVSQGDEVSPSPEWAKPGDHQRNGKHFAYSETGVSLLVQSLNVARHPKGVHLDSRGRLNT